MSDNYDPNLSAEENQLIETAKAEYTQFLKDFEKKYGYGIGAVTDPNIDPVDGTLRVPTFMKLVKLPPAINTDAPVAAPAAETPVSKPQNGDSTTEETSPSDSKERDAS